METSAKASINVEEAFFTLARDIKAKMDKKLVSLTHGMLLRLLFIVRGANELLGKNGKITCKLLWFHLFSWVPIFMDCHKNVWFLD